MPKSTKIIICAAMSLGVFAGICGIVRAINLLGLNARSDYSCKTSYGYCSFDANKIQDETVGLILWSSTELLVTIMTACIPCYRELWIRLFRKARSDFSKQSTAKFQDSNRHSIPMEYGAGTNKVETSIYFGEGDSSSDRAILQNGEQVQGVKITSDVVVNVESQETLST